MAEVAEGTRRPRKRQRRGRVNTDAAGPETGSDRGRGGGLQPTWRAVAALLPDVAGAAGAALEDVELMATLAPDVLLLRTDNG